MARCSDRREGITERQTGKERQQDKQHQRRNKDEKSEDETKTRKGEDRRWKKLNRLCVLIKDELRMVESCEERTEQKRV